MDTVKVLGKQFLNELIRRLSPLFMFIDARFLPVLLLGAVQAKTIYDWLLISDPSPAGQIFAVIGAASLESAYIGLAAWAENRSTGHRLALATELIAVTFSSFVAIYMYQGQGKGALLHVAFPIMLLCYMEAMRASMKGIMRDTVITPPVAPQVVEPKTPQKDKIDFNQPPIWSKPTITEAPKSTIHVLPGRTRGRPRKLVSSK